MGEGGGRGSNNRRQEPIMGNHGLLSEIWSRAYQPQENYGGPQGQYKNISPNTKHLSQYKNNYPSTKIITPIKKKYLSQYKSNYPSTKIFIPVQKFLSQYKNISPSPNNFLNISFPRRAHGITVLKVFNRLDDVDISV